MLKINRELQEIVIKRVAEYTVFYSYKCSNGGLFFNFRWNIILTTILLQKIQLLIMQMLMLYTMVGKNHKVIIIIWLIQITIQSSKLCLLVQEKMVVMLRNYAMKKGYNTNTTNSLTKFKDYKKVSAYAQSALGWAVDKGIMSGTSDGQLTPLSKETRSECVKMFLQLYKLK